MESRGYGKRISSPMESYGKLWKAMESYGKRISPHMESTGEPSLRKEFKHGGSMLVAGV
jgi:hypothetical protein